MDPVKNTNSPAKSVPPAKKPKANPYRFYRPKSVEMRPFVAALGLGADVRARITAEQAATGSPKAGDMIAKYPNGERLVTAEEFAANFDRL